MDSGWTVWTNRVWTRGGLFGLTVRTRGGLFGLTVRGSQDGLFGLTVRGLGVDCLD